MTKKGFIITIIGFIICFVLTLWFSIKHTQEIYFDKGNEYGFENGLDRGKKIGDSIGFNRGFDTKYEDLKKLEEIFYNLKYKYQPNIDYVQIVNSVAKIGSSNDKNDINQFYQILTQLDIELIDFLSENFEINESDKLFIMTKYNAIKDSLNSTAYDEVVHLNKTLRLTNESTIYSRKYFDGIRNFDKILADRICFLSTIFNSSITNAPSSSLFVRATTASICPSLIAYVAKPLIIELKKQAIIMDYDESRIEIKNEVSNQIAELATAEYKSDAFKQKTFTKEIDWPLFGICTYSANVNIYAQSIAKAGFDLRVNA